MFKGITFPNEVEALVRFVEESDPQDIVEHTLDKLRNGTPAVDLLRAAVLAVCRSTELPPEHHGGPVHPICGVHGVYNTSKRLQGELGFIPIVQHVTLCNNHVHSPQMGPYVMPEMIELNGTGTSIGSYHLNDNNDNFKDIEVMDSTEDAFLRAIEVRKPSLAEQYYLWLEGSISRGAILDLLLPASVSRNGLDDHYFIYPMFTYRTLDIIGWEWAPVLMRVAVRYQSRNPSMSLSHGSDRVSELLGRLLKKYSLTDQIIPARTSSRETSAIGDLGGRIGSCIDYLDGMEMMAEALSSGMSLEGAGEALSIGATEAYLKSSYGNPMDSHLHTGTNARRYLVAMKDVSQKYKVQALITGLTGPECINGSRVSWDKTDLDNKLESLPDRDQNELLETITESIESQPLADWRGIGVDNLVLEPDFQQTILLGKQYADKRYSPEVLFKRLGMLISRDDFTELHGIKHHQAIVDEFYETREPYRWKHLVAAVKSAAVIEGGKERNIYDQTMELLKV